MQPDLKICFQCKHFLYEQNPIFSNFYSLPDAMLWVGCEKAGFDVNAVFGPKSYDVTRWKIHDPEKCAFWLEQVLVEEQRRLSPWL